MWRHFRRGVSFYDTEYLCCISVKTTGTCENRQEYVTVCPSSQWHWFKHTSASIHPAGVSLSKTLKAFRTALTWMFLTYGDFAWLEAPVDNKRLELGSGPEANFGPYRSSLRVWFQTETTLMLMWKTCTWTGNVWNEQIADFDFFSHSGKKSSFGCETLACTVLTF